MVIKGFSNSLLSCFAEVCHRLLTLAAVDNTLCCSARGHDLPSPDQFNASASLAAPKPLAELQAAILSRARTSQIVNNFSEPVLQPLERQIVEELTPPQQPSICIAQVRFVTGRVPVSCNHGDLVPHDRQGALIPEKKLVGRGEAQRQLAAPLAAVDLHGLRGFASGPRLWANVVGRREGARLSPSQKAAWFRAWSSVLPTRML